MFKGKISFKPFQLQEKGNYSIANVLFHYEIHEERDVEICQIISILALFFFSAIVKNEPSLFFVGAVSLLGGLILVAHLMLFRGKDWRNFIMDNFLNEGGIMAVCICVIVAGSFLPGGSLLVSLGSVFYSTVLTAFVAGFFGEATPNVPMIDG